MIDFRTIVKIMAAFGAGVVVAGFFLSGPVMRPVESPAPPSAAQTSAVATPAIPPPPAQAEHRPQTDPQRPEPSTYRQVRVIPIDRTAAPETTGSSPADRSAERAERGLPPPVAAPPRCDVSACERAYRSFRASDCSYRSYSGARKLCPFGSPGEDGRTARDTPPETQAMDADARSEGDDGPPCNVAACSRTYNSFDAASCTYQPYDGGPRRLCEK